MQNQRASVRRWLALGAGAARRGACPGGVTLLTTLILSTAIATSPAASAAQTEHGGRASHDGATARSALAKTYVKEHGHLHYTSKSGGSAIAEQGTATGTFNASININLTVKISRITGTFVAYLKGGSISGVTSATPHVSGQWVSFKGSLTIKHGTGRYAGASGTASLYGSLNRVQLQLNVQVVGRLRL